MMKPFKPPTIVKKLPSQQPSRQSDQEPAHKKRRTISTDSNAGDFKVPTSSLLLAKSHISNKTFKVPQRPPCVPIENPEENPQVGLTSEHVDREHYNVLWRKFTTKKNKTWDGDGVLSVTGTYAVLQDVSGRELGRGTCNGPVVLGSELSIAGREIEVGSTISPKDFLEGRPFLSKSKTSIHQTGSRNEIKNKSSFKALSQDQRVKPVQVQHHNPATTKAVKSAFKAPLLNDTVLETRKSSSVPTPRHDPNAEGALVMKRPKSVPKGKQIVDVVIDPLLTKNLREHQRAGVAFMYECVMGMKSFTGEGAILADEMGLGKTLQTIALIWTLLKQNPVYEEAPVIKKALIVCPVTLINNWRKEFAKWLGKERIGVFVAGNKNTRLTDFTLGRAYSVMIIGYEKLRNVQADLQKGTGIDLVIADEGHRLKTAQNKSAQAIKSLNTERRIILSGTPLQNDLAEFYTMVDFVNPGLLNKYPVFKREFELPILKSRQPEASSKDVETGEARSEELAEITGKFILRRTAEILSKYLPPKTEYVVFCKPTNTQARVYRSIVDSPIFNAALGSPALSLELINLLKKVCNSPSLLARKLEDHPSEALSHIPPSLLRSPGASGKLQVLDSLLHQLHTTSPAEKVVIVSNYTSTLDLLATLLSSLSYPFLRLDGTTPPAKRQELVDRFNRSPASVAFAFLLSAKAGGTGLNLIGASRCVLFDLDWNPATDLQAMARVHRDGQCRPVYIYRLLTQGALDEKIFQRQISKTGLADRIVDGKAGVSGFTREELRDLFRLHDASTCQTHELSGCGCGGVGVPLEVEDAEGDREKEEDGGWDALESRGFATAREYEEMFREDDEEVEGGGGRSGDGLEGGGRKKKRGGKGMMLSLMQYTHFDPVHVAMQPEVREGKRLRDSAGDDVDGGVEEGDGGDTADISVLDAAIEDQVLRNALREDGGRIGYVFAKMNS